MLLYEELTRKIIWCFYRVYNELGVGFLEKVYEKALAHELRKQGLTVQLQHPITVYYDDVDVGEYFADIIVEDTIILELKAVEEINKVHEVQLLNYLKATNKRVGLLLNFGKEPQHRRKVL